MASSADNRKSILTRKQGSYVFSSGDLTAWQFFKQQLYGAFFNPGIYLFFFNKLNNNYINVVIFL